MPEDVFLRVRRVLSRSLKVREDEILTSTSMDNFRPWDSLQFLHVITALEQEFAVRFMKPDLKDLRSVDKILRILGSYGE